MSPPPLTHTYKPAHLYEPTLLLWTSGQMAPTTCSRSVTLPGGSLTGSWSFGAMERGLDLAMCIIFGRSARHIRNWRDRVDGRGMEDGKESLDPAAQPR